MRRDDEFQQRLRTYSEDPNVKVRSIRCCIKIEKFFENSLAVQCFGFHTSIVGGTGQIPGQGTKISQATQCGQKQTNKQTKPKKP